jgi:hypothetical protein
MLTYVKPKVSTEGTPIIMNDTETMHQPPGQTLSPPLYVKLPMKPLCSDLRGLRWGAFVYCESWLEMALWSLLTLPTTSACIDCS